MHQWRMRQATLALSGATRAPTHAPCLAALRQAGRGVTTTCSTSRKLKGASQGVDSSARSLSLIDASCTEARPLAASLSVAPPCPFPGAGRCRYVFSSHAERTELACEVSFKPAPMV
jgi:hypothetical protein